MYLSTKLRNAIKKFDSNYEVKLKNITVNGEKRGCSGFVINPTNGVIVYVNTEKGCFLPLSERNLYRYAKNEKDYGGSHSRNRWAKDENLAKCIHESLQNITLYQEWLEGVR